MSVNSISSNTGYLARSSSSGQSCQQSQSSSNSSSTKKSAQGSVTVDFSTLAMLLQQAQSGSSQSSTQASGSTQSSSFSLAGIGGTSSSGMPPPPGMDGTSGAGGPPPFKEMDQALSDLSTALESGDIDGAKKALATFQSLAPKPPDASNDSSGTTSSSSDTSTDETTTADTTADGTTTASGTSSTSTSGSTLSDKLAALSDALDSGDTDAAKSAYEALMEDIQSHKPDDGMQARQRQHHMGQYMQMATLGSDSTSTTSAVSTST